MPDEKPKLIGSLELKDVAVIVPLIASSIALAWEVGAFLPTGGFTLFSLSDHFIAAINASPIALFFSAVAGAGALSIGNVDTPKTERESRLIKMLTIGIGSAICAASAYYFASKGHALAPVMSLGAIVGLILFLGFEFRLRSAVGLMSITLFFLSATLAASADVTLQRIRSATRSTTVVTKSGSVTGSALMFGSSGILLYRQDEKIVHFERMDEVKNIEWSRPTTGF